MNLTLRFDGASGNNQATIGWYIVEAPELAGAETVFQGDMVTNNIAEYLALIRGLAAARRIDPLPKRLTVQGDSELVIKQMNGEYRVLNMVLEMMAGIAKRFEFDLTQAGVEVVYQWIPGAENKVADRLSRGEVLANLRL